jgi:hypothetical protein
MIGGLVPLMPYVFFDRAQTALYVSVRCVDVDWSYGVRVVCVWIRQGCCDRKPSKVVECVADDVYRYFELRLGVLAGAAAYFIAKAIPQEQF